MADNEKIFIALGQLQESVKNIKENTDQIPNLATGLALVTRDVNIIKPKVEKHQKVMWVGSGVLAVFSFAWTAILSLLEGGHK